MAEPNSATAVNHIQDGGQNMRLWFESENVSRSSVRVEVINGQEAISRPYRYEIVFISQSSISARDIIGHTAKVGIIDLGQELVANGVILQFEQRDPAISGDYVYRVILVPRFSLLEFTQQNRIYGTETALTPGEIIDQMVAGELRRQSIFQGGREAIIEVEKRLFSSYPSRSHVVQYHESDLAFISRLCEHFGIFYFFEQGETGEVAIFGDSNIAFNLADLPDGKLRYLRAGPTTHRNSCVTSLRSEHRVLTNRIILTEYNAELPSVALQAQADVSSDGFGFFVEYGQNFQTPDDGAQLAKVRAQELAATGTVFFGESTSPQIRPGVILTIEEHPDPSFNIRYLVTEVVHDATLPVGPYQGADVEQRAYFNRFTAIPSDTEFRPKRVTPRPLATGIYSATIDGTGSGERAELDDQGRYKVRVFYDDGNSPDGRATEFIRKAEPYAGAGDSGMHFPLLKGTEVALAFTNGDPDRPLIVGAVANPATPNVVTNANHQRNRLVSTTGVMFEINDGSPADASAVSSGTEIPHQSMHQLVGADGGLDHGNQSSSNSHHAPNASGLPLQDHYAHPPIPHPHPPAPPIPHPPVPPHTPPVPVQLQVQNSARLSAPGQANSYLRLGSATDGDATTWTTGLGVTSTVPSTASGAPVTTSSSADDLYSQKPKTSLLAGATYDDGVLIGTVDNLVINAEKSALIKIGEGIKTSVTSNDHNTEVDAGAFIVTASEGIYMTSGTVHNGAAVGKQTNIVLTATGYVKTTSLGDSHVYSHKDNYTYIVGNKYQDIQGNNVSTIEGTSTSTITGNNYSMLFGGEEVFKLGGRFSVNLGAGLAINGAIDLKLILGGEISFQIPFALKMVIGADIKFVLGYDIKIVTVDVKVVSTAKYEVTPVTNKASEWDFGAFGVKANNAATTLKANKAKAELTDIRTAITNLGGEIIETKVIM